MHSVAYKLIRISFPCSFCCRTILRLTPYDAGNTYIYICARRSCRAVTSLSAGKTIALDCFVCLVLAYPHTILHCQYVILDSLSWPGSNETLQCQLCQQHSDTDCSCMHMDYGQVSALQGRSSSTSQLSRLHSQQLAAFMCSFVHIQDEKDCV